MFPNHRTKRSLPSPPFFFSCFKRSCKPNSQKCQMNLHLFQKYSHRLSEIQLIINENEPLCAGSELDSVSLSGFFHGTVTHKP